MFSNETEILRKLKMIECLKAEIVTEVGRLYHAMAQHAEQGIAQALAGIVIWSYILAKRLGIDFADLDEVVVARLDKYIQQEHEIEQLFGDMSHYQRYLKQKR